jgi:hypothetical protein
MPQTMPICVDDLSLDLGNFRTVRQMDEPQAVQAMIAISPDRFWALMESLLEESGYLPTENILVLDHGSHTPKYIVKEGNRRIAALKLIHGILPRGSFNIPGHILQRIDSLSQEWKRDNSDVPCAVYTPAEATTVDRIVTLAHGKDQRAGRDQWNAVARARHNRDARGASEPYLDLLEAYLNNGKNLSDYEAECWSGIYPLTVLEEAMKRIASRFGVATAPELTKIYPVVAHRDALEAILRDIGLGIIQFKTIRQKQDFAARYGVPPAAPSSGGTPGAAAGAAAAAGGSAAGGSAGGSTSGTSGTTSSSQGSKKPAAVAMESPEAVMRALRKFKPRGSNREKVESIRREALELNLEKTPLAFCFLLRSMFEISAKAYCVDNAASGLSATHPNGNDRKLAEVLDDVASHLIGATGSTNMAMVKALHGAKVEFTKAESILSVTSMNQLVHNPTSTLLTEGRE